jgi:hypothetical protein
MRLPSLATPLAPEEYIACLLVEILYRAAQFLSHLHRPPHRRVPHYALIPALEVRVVCILFSVRKTTHAKCSVSSGRPTPRTASPRSPWTSPYPARS